MAASCAVASLSSMLLLVSSRIASAIGCCTCEKKREGLLDPVLEDLEVLLLESGDVFRAVGDRDVQRHELDAGAEPPLLRASRDRRRTCASAAAAARSRRIVIAPIPWCAREPSRPDAITVT